MHAYDKTRNLIEIGGQGVKIITLPHDHNLSYKDNTCHGKLLFSTSSTAVLLYIGKTAYPRVLYSKTWKNVNGCI